MADDQNELESFYLKSTLDGLDVEPEVLAGAIDCVELEDIVQIARSIVPDAVYYLRGTDEEDGDEA